MLTTAAPATAAAMPASDAGLRCRAAMPSCDGCVDCSSSIARGRFEALRQAGSCNGSSSSGRGSGSPGTLHLSDQIGHVATRVMNAILLCCQHIKNQFQFQFLLPPSFRQSEISLTIYHCTCIAINLTFNAAFNLSLHLLSSLFIAHKSICYTKDLWFAKVRV